MYTVVYLIYRTSYPWAARVRTSTQPAWSLAASPKITHCQHDVHCPSSPCQKIITTYGVLHKLKPAWHLHVNGWVGSTCIWLFAAQCSATTILIHVWLTKKKSLHVDIELFRYSVFAFYWLPYYYSKYTALWGGAGLSVMAFNFISKM